ncbi:sortase domain-bontaining protein [Alkalihalobacillus sp. AL-G]|uniref:sortase domain-containing protein n=1 Tax=Alkalihalobacillus sp. AL-G TaxID=2926399 RepID=UPI002729A385|nr:sortase [Alkalihalobacillus sp. AL-G]WLD93342.1 sortase [Alkalihalobacillus sp. AL-G]
MKDRQHQYIYKVYNMLVGDPDNLSVLEGYGNDKLLTLNTCDPIETATHRLIIQAKIKDVMSETP